MTWYLLLAWLHQLCPSIPAMHDMSVNPVFYSVQAPAGLNECSQSIYLFISKLIDEMFKCKD